MRTWLLVLMTWALTMIATTGRAQDLNPDRLALTRAPRAARQADNVRDQRSGRRRPVAAVQRVVDKWRPLRQRLPQDQRIRALSGVVGVSILAYQAIPRGQKLPLSVVGAEALRIGLDPQIRAFRRRTGFALEPSIGHRRFAVTLRRTF
jgi:hypothetical protein